MPQDVPAGFIPDPPMTAGTVPAGFVPDTPAGGGGPQMNFAIVNGQRVPVDAEGNPLPVENPSLWQRANTPPAVVQQLQARARRNADILDAPSLDRSPLRATVEGALAGMGTGTMDLLASFTTPVGALLLLSGLGEDSAIVQAIPALKPLLALPAVQKVQAAVRGAGGLAMTGAGAEQVVRGDTWAEKAMGLPTMAAGALGIASVPAVRQALGLDLSIPQWRQARGVAQGERATAQQTSDVLRAIPPSSRAPYDPYTWERARPYLEAEHATTPIASVVDLRDAADSAITQIEEHVGQAIAAHPNDLLRTNPLAAVRRGLGGSVKAGDLEAGLKELEGYGLDQPLTVERADAIRLRLNAENKAVLKRNNYDVATARETDPAFAAREIAANVLREGIYTQLEARGINGIADLRRDEGSLIQIRNAAQRQAFVGDRPVGGTGANTPARRVAGRLLTMAGSGGGAVVGGPVGAVVGGAVGNEAAGLLTRPNLTRDELVARAFSRSQGLRPAYPAIPADRPPAGLLPAPALGLPAPADASVVRGVPAQFGEQPLLPPAARPMPAAPDTSFVRGVPADVAQRQPAGLLPAPARQMPAAPDVSGVGVVPARGIVVRDPRTGRFRRVYTAEGVVP